MQLSKWLAADAAGSTGQSYVLDDGGERQEKTLANAAEFHHNVQYWNCMVRRLSGGGIRCLGVIPSGG